MAWSVAHDPSDPLKVVMTSQSDGWNFPTTPGVLQRTRVHPDLEGDPDVGITAFRFGSASGGRVEWSTPARADQRLHLRSRRRHRRVLISGAVFIDANGDRSRQSTETGLAGWRVFLDADRDGVLDSAERSTLTDAAGSYRFRDLPAGSYSVRVVQQSGRTRTTPTGGSYSITLTSGQSATNRLFGERRLT